MIEKEFEVAKKDAFRSDSELFWVSQCHVRKIGSQSKVLYSIEDYSRPMILQGLAIDDMT